MGPKPPDKPVLKTGMKFACRLGLSSGWPSDDKHNKPREKEPMRTIMKWLAVSILAVAIVPFLAHVHLPFDHTDRGIAYAKGGGGGGDHGNGGHDGGSAGGRGSDAGRGDDHGGWANGHSNRGAGNAVSEAATSTAHAGKTAAQRSGFRNLGQAVRSAVHKAQRHRHRDRGRDRD